MATLRGRRLPPSTAVRAGLVGLAALRLARRPARVRSTAPDPTDPGAITIVIPARDEAARIGPCLASTLASGARVVVVDDGSTDDTAALARAAGADVVDAGPLPAGWAGKAHALQVGLEAATTPTVVTLDADTRLLPGALPRLVALAAGTTLTTAAARVDARSRGERWLHPSLLATLVYRFGRPGAPPASPSRAMASGQCMVLDRAEALDAGGMAPVRSHLLEDLALARHLAADGHAVGFVDGADLVQVDGYGSAAEAWRGWGRSLDLAEVTPWPAQALDLAVLWAALALPLPRLLLGRADPVDLVALALRAGVTVGTRRAYTAPGVVQLASPVADPAVVARLTWGTLRPDRRWRGRTYD